MNTEFEPDDIPHKGSLHWIWYWGPVVLYACLIFYLSSQSYPEQYVPHFLLKLGDKALHAMEYGLLGFLCYRAFRHAAGPWCQHRAVLLAVLTATLYGATDEWHQAFVPFRESDRWDLATDLLGACLGVVARAWIETRRVEGCRHTPRAPTSGGPSGGGQRPADEAMPEPEAR